MTLVMRLKKGRKAGHESSKNNLYNNRYYIGYDIAVPRSTTKLFVGAV